MAKRAPNAPKPTAKSPAKSPTRRAARPSASAARAPKPGTAPGFAVGVVAPSSPAPLVELEQAAFRLSEAGFEVFFHPQVKRVAGLFAGSDDDRALAFLDYAFDPELRAIWTARGGYGAIRLLPILDEVVRKVGMPERKTLVGFSDATLLLDYVRRRWNWRVIHGPMPATFHIERVRGAAWKKFVATLADPAAGFAFRAKPVFRPPGFRSASGEVAGGNLAMIHSVLGTPYAFDLRDKILFLEEIGEAPYRMDRMVRQLALAGAFAGVRAIVLGTFTDCRDASPQVYAQPPRAGGKPRMKPLRKTLSERQVIDTIFGDLGRELGIPVYAGLPVGHGEGTACLELGIPAELRADGRFFSVSPGRAPARK